VVDDSRARAKLDEILVSRQMVFVTGKGGVGKSTVTAALALRARNLGLRPLVFELDAPPRGSLFEHGRAAGDEVEEIAPGILGINQQSDAAIRDYAASTLPSKTVADLLFENSIAKLFLKASPSVSEMALIGRVAHLAEKHGADGPILVDLHATGHALSLVRAPGGIMKVLRSGALFDRARRIEEMLADKRRTAFITVALPEELPVTELLELRAKLIELGAPDGPVILNGALDDPAPVVGDDVLAHIAKTTGVAKHPAEDLQTLKTWARRGKREEQRLRDALPSGDIVRFPLLIDDGPAWKLTRQLSEYLGRGAGT
jgi:anion-transporting  ArsA/GET3 family ATPase